MSILSILNAANGLFNLVRDGLALIPNENKRRELEAAFLARQQEIISAINNAQMEVNKIEAAHPSRFVSGWRPACGWVCVTGFAVAFLLMPIAKLIVAIWWPWVSVPELDLSGLITMLMGMLGLGGLRTYDKLKGTDTK